MERALATCQAGCGAGPGGGVWLVWYGRYDRTCLSFFFIAGSRYCRYGLVARVWQVYYGQYGMACMIRQLWYGRYGKVDVVWQV